LYNKDSDSTGSGKNMPAHLLKNRKK